MKIVSCKRAESVKKAEKRRVEALPWHKRLFTNTEIGIEHDYDVVLVTDGYFRQPGYRTEIVLKCLDCGKREVTYSMYAKETVKALRPADL